MFATRRFKWLPNALTFSRLLLAVPIFLLAVNEHWTAAFWVLLLAIFTDFLDGLAAKKLGASSKFGEALDPLADSSLVVAGLLGLSITGHVSWVITIAVFVFGLSVGNPWFMTGKNHRRDGLRKMASVVCLFVAWVCIAWFFAALAFGWSWWYVVLTAAVLAIAASLKRHRIRAWIGIYR